MSDSKTNPANLNQVVTKAPTKGADAKTGETQTATETKAPAAAKATVPEPVQQAIPQASELDTLKARAKVMGIQFSPNIGVDSLREKIAEKTASLENTTAAVIQTPGAPAEPPKGETKLQAQLRVRKELIKEQTKLVRCRIECMNPAKNDLKGEIFTTGNRFVGKISKFIPYGEETTHIPYMLYTMLKNKKFLKITREKIKGTNNYTNPRRLVNEFSIEVLEPLTEQELKDLAARQQAAQALEAQ